MATFDQAGKLEYTFGFDSIADITKIIHAIGVSPTALTIRRNPEFVHENQDSDGATTWRLFGPEVADYSLEGFLFCEDKFRKATGFSYKGDDYIIEGREIDRSNQDYIQCRITGKSHVNISIPKELLDTYGVLFASRPKTSAISTSSETFDALASSPVSQISVVGTKGSSPTMVDAWVSGPSTTGLTSVYGAPLPNGSYRTHFSASPVSAPVGTTYRSGLAAIGSAASSVTVTFPNSIASPWIQAQVILPSTSSDQITGYVDQASVTTSGFDFYLEQAALTSGYVLHWEARELGETPSGHAYGYTDLSSEESSFVVDYSAREFGETPAFFNTQLAAPTSGDEFIEVDVNLKTATHNQVTALFDSPIPSGDTYRLYWQAKLI